MNLHQQSPIRSRNRPILHYRRGEISETSGIGRKDADDICRCGCRRQILRRRADHESVALAQEDISDYAEFIGDRHELIGDYSKLIGNNHKLIGNYTEFIRHLHKPVGELVRANPKLIRSAAKSIACDDKLIRSEYIPAHGRSRR